MATVYLAEDLQARPQGRDQGPASRAGRRHRRRALPRRDQDHRRTSSTRTSSALIDSGDADGLLYYVMPYVEGESLRDRLDARQAAPHRRRAPHRDAKSPPRSTTPTATASSIATSSPRTSCCRTATPWSPTSASRSRAAGRRLPDDRRPACRSAPRRTCRPEQAMGRARHRRAQRHLRARRDDLRDARRRAALHRAHLAGHRREGADGDTSAAVAQRATVSRGRGARRAHRAAEAPRRSLRQREGVRRRARRQGDTARGDAPR